MAKLKPSPFCGGIATLYAKEIPNGYSGDINYIIECTSCEANIHGYDTEQQAIEAWNKRS